MTPQKILFGDNQFFGVNHMSEEKARAQAMKFRDARSIMNVLDSAYEAGIHAFMCTTHDRVGDIVDIVNSDPTRYADFEFYPCMPYAHKYANSVGEVGIVETVKRFAPGGILDTLIRGSISAATQDVSKVMNLLVDSELARFKNARMPAVFLQNVVTDLLLGLGANDMLGAFARYVKERYGADPGFITMNLPKLLQVLQQQGVENPLVCANINKIGFRMSGGVDTYLDTIRGSDARVIAMSVFASGAIAPAEAIDWACQVEGLDSIVFGASSKANINHTKQLIDSHWARR